MYFSHGVSNSKGVSIILKNSFPFTIHNEITDNEGWFLALDITIYDTRLTIANIYGTNADVLQIYIPNDHRIVGGDFNFVCDVLETTLVNLNLT